MKKASLALAVLAASTSAAWAQSSVTVYGILDAGVSTVTGLAGGSKKMLVSGIMDGSRIGFKGNEDLGGGYRAVFTLENRLEVDTGATSNAALSGGQLPDRWSKGDLIFPATSLPTFTLPANIPAAQQAQIIGGANTILRTVLNGTASAIAGNLGPSVAGVNIGGARFWDRQAFVGLVTPYGAVLAGRQYTPAYEVNAEFDVMQTQSSLAFGQIAAIPGVIDIRQSNSLQYRIQTGGITASVMAAAGEGGTTQGHFLGAMVMYRSSDFSVGFGYNARENELGQKSLRSAVLGASAALGPGRLSLVVASFKDDNPAQLPSAVYPGFLAAMEGTLKSTMLQRLGPQAGALINAQINSQTLLNQYKTAFVQDSNGFGIGYRMNFGAMTVYTAYNRLNDKTRFNADTDSYGVVLSYAFSKRTDANLALTHFDNKKNGQAAPGATGYLGGVTSAPGVNSNSFAMGLRHRF